MRASFYSRLAWCPIAQTSTVSDDVSANVIYLHSFKPSNRHCPSYELLNTRIYRYKAYSLATNALRPSSPRIMSLIPAESVQFKDEFAIDVEKSSLKDDSITVVPLSSHESRLELERKLVQKLDLRMSILVVIYILNYVSVPSRTYMAVTNVRTRP